MRQSPFLDGASVAGAKASAPLSHVALSSLITGVAGVESRGHHTVYAPEGLVMWLEAEDAPGVIAGPCSAQLLAHGGQLFIEISLHRSVLGMTIPPRRVLAMRVRKFSGLGAVARAAQASASVSTGSHVSIH